MIIQKSLQHPASGFSYSPLTPRERERLRLLMAGHRFDASVVLGAGSRCRFGGVRVLVCAPVSKNLRPFPTTFWLTCPWLTRRAGTVEADGGVRRLEAWLSGSPLRGRQWKAYGLLHQSVRLGLLSPELKKFLSRFHRGLFDTLRLGGVGGTRCDRQDGAVHVKCLHLQAASWLALGHHPGAEWLHSERLDGDCGEAEKENENKREGAKKIQCPFVRPLY